MKSLHQRIRIRRTDAIRIDKNRRFLSILLLRSERIHRILHVGKRAGRIAAGHFVEGLRKLPTVRCAYREQLRFILMCRHNRKRTSRGIGNLLLHRIHRKFQSGLAARIHVLHASARIEHHDHIGIRIAFAADVRSH